MGNIFSSGNSSDGLIGNLSGGVGSLFSFATHPLESIMLFVGGILLLLIVYKIIAD